MTKLTFTVGEIAERIRETDEPVASVINRIRSWTKEGVLKPISDEAPGTGRKLRYPERAIVDAAILSRLARHYGLWATRPLFTGTLDMLDAANKQLPKAKFLTEGDPARLIYLIIGVTGEGKDQRAVFGIQYVDDPWLSRPAKAGRPKREIELSPFMSDGFFINLTDLFLRIRVPLKDFEEEESFYKMFPDVKRITRG